ncbi:MAG: DNA/RNA nuclease SfsA [Geobacteraceae bacterium]|nr:DNA/RNA nuclease SfsA [Geobacteraceae bacterium]
MLLPPLVSGRLIRRYKRFLADVELDGGEVVTTHCPNSGSMRGCALPGSLVLLSRSDNPARKLAYTWELVMADGCWVGLNTGLPNKLAFEGIKLGIVTELQGYENLRTEVCYGSERSRIDLLLENPGRCYVEVKNVTLVEDGQARFPDAVTERGQKHLRELISMVEGGYRAVNFFTVQRADARSVTPADDIDPVYGKLLRQAAAAGVELLAYQASVTPAEIVLSHPLPIIL